VEGVGFYRQLQIFSSQGGEPSEFFFREHERQKGKLVNALTVGRKLEFRHLIKQATETSTVIEIPTQILIDFTSAPSIILPSDRY
jgi:hypothetical protein